MSVSSKVCSRTEVTGGTFFVLHSASKAARYGEAEHADWSDSMTTQGELKLARSKGKGCNVEFVSYETEEAKSVLTRLIGFAGGLLSLGTRAHIVEEATTGDADGGPLRTRGGLGHREAE